MTFAAPRPELIECLPEDPAVRVARIRRFLARTLHFNGYYKGFGRTPEARAAKLTHLREWPLEPDVAEMRRLLEQGGDPVADFLDRLASIGVLRPASDVKRQEWRAQWERVETTLNARLSIALALMPADVLGRVVEVLVPEVGRLGALSIAMVRSDQIEKSSQGFADLILKGPSAVVLIELKVRGLTTKHNYDVAQLLKYATLAADERETWTRPGARRLVHLLLRPRRGGGCVLYRGRWFLDPEVAGGAIRLDPSALRIFAEHVDLVDGFDRERALRMIDEMPVYDRHYDELADCLPAGSLGPWDAQVRHQIRQVCVLAEPRGEVREAV